MTTQLLTEQIQKKLSFLCVGLDSDLTKLPSQLRNRSDAQFAFNKAIIDATHDLAVSYKINTAFYESEGSMGYQALEQTIQYLHENYPNHFTIADAKRGDIGNTSTQYARAFLRNFRSILSQLLHIWGVILSSLFYSFQVSMQYY